MRNSLVAVGLAAGLSFVGASRRGGSRSLPMRRFQDLSARTPDALSATPRAYAEELEHNLDVMSKVYPRSAQILRDRITLDVRESDVENAWFSPYSIILTRNQASPGFVSHQAVHALDYEGGRYASLSAQTPASELVKKVARVVEPRLTSLSEEIATDRLQALPQGVAGMLRAGAVPARVAHEALVRELGSPYGVDDVDRAVEDARGPFGINAEALRASLSMDARLADALIALASMRPVGVPMRLFGKPKETREYMESYNLSNLKRSALDYLKSGHEIFARMMDQVLREEALRIGRPILRRPRVRPDDVPLELLPTVEEDAWRVAHQMGWLRGRG